MKTDRHWAKVGKCSHHGISLALSALHSKNSCGVGEFYDLLPLFPWLRSVGFDCLQLLPLTDSGEDASPYNPIASYALNPIYITLTALPELDRYPDLKDEMAGLQELTQRDRVLYGEVRRRKLQWLFRYYQSIRPEIKRVSVYDRYCSGCDGYPSEFHAFLQKLCDQQLGFVKKSAEQNNILLVGDVSILVSARSVDVWEEPSLFIPALHVGAPPDLYTGEGQNWFFPVMDFQKLQEQDFGWWKRRLAFLDRFFHVYRIDHAVGLFRFWIIPEGKSSREGFFFPNALSEALKQGKAMIQALLESSDLLPIAEDLGSVPDEVKKCFCEEGICCMQIFQMEVPGTLHCDPYTFSALSTHDSPPIRLWWRESPELAERLAECKGWTYAPELTQAQQIALLRDSHQTPGYFHINILPDYLTLYPELSHSHLEEERMNIPGSYLDSNWTSRYRPSVEELVSHRLISEVLINVIKPS